jgi:hypothetical protein
LSNVEFENKVTYSEIKIVINIIVNVAKSVVKVYINSMFISKDKIAITIL